MPYNERELIVLTAEGDESAFSCLFKLYKNKIYTVAYKLTHSASLAEDIVQDVFLTIWLRRSDLPNVHNFSAYLFTILRNDVYKAMKQIARNHAASVALTDSQFSEYNNTEYYLTGKECDFILHQAVQSLPGQQKQVYILMKQQGLKREEVARMLQLSPETVKYHLAQAMKNIRVFYLHHYNPVHWVNQLTSFPDTDLAK